MKSYLHANKSDIRIKSNIHVNKSNRIKSNPHVNKSMIRMKSNLHVNIVDRPAHILEDRLEGHVKVASQEPVLHPE